MKLSELQKQKNRAQNKKARIIAESMLFVLVLIAALLLRSSCSGAVVAKIYSYENGEIVKLRKTVREKDEDFLIELINNNYIIGDADGNEEPNFAIVYNQGTDEEYTYKLMVNLETDIITYVTDDRGGTTAPKVFNSYTKSLEFYDFLSK